MDSLNVINDTNVTDHNVPGGRPFSIKVRVNVWDVIMVNVTEMKTFCPLTVIFPLEGLGK